MALSRCIPFCLTGVILLLTSITWPSIEATNITFECGKGWDLIGTHCYNFVNVSVDFEDARDNCERYGARLLVVRDEVEAKGVASKANTKFAGNSFWIYNGRDQQKNINETYCTGFWQPDEPREPNIDEDVAITSNKQGRWAVTWAWENLPFVCRTPACPAGSFRCSSGSCLTGKWRCDGVPECEDQSDEYDCSDNIKYYRNGTGSIDTSTLKNNKGSTYQWIIEAQPGDILRIKIESLSLVDNIDSVRIYSGSPTIKKHELVQVFTKRQPTPLTVYGKNHFLIVILQSLSSTASLKFNWETDNEASWRGVNSYKASRTPFNIKSPYFGSTLTPTSFKKEWHLTAPQGQLITLEVLNSSFEDPSVFIVTNVGFQLQELNSRKAVYISRTKSMVVIIKTHSQHIFLARFSIGCDVNAQLTLASFSAFSLPENITCQWNIVNEHGTRFRLNIDQFAFTDPNESLKIYNGSVASGKPEILINQSTTGAKEYEKLGGNILLEYHSGPSLPGFKVNGRITADCPALTSSNSQSTYLSPIASGDLYRSMITCDEGFSFKQEEYNRNQTVIATCKQGGAWDWGSPSLTRTPECQIVYCGFPAPIANGYISDITTNGTYNSTAVYECNLGYRLNTLSSIKCQKNGTWTRPPTCVLSSRCPAVQPIVNGKNSSNGDLNPGTLVNFSCDPGYDLRGPPVIRCLENSSWSHLQPRCTELTCSLPNIAHGNHITRNGRLPIYGEYLELRCDSGYQIARTRTLNASIKCESNRQLEFGNDTCIDINECGNVTLNTCSRTQNCINTEGSYECVCKEGFNGTNCTDIDECQLGLCNQNCINSPGSFSCGCYPGFTLYTWNGTNGFNIPDGEDGLKVADVLQINRTCVRVPCPQLPSVTNATILAVKSKYYYNDTIEVVCDFGFRLYGTSIATCQSGGRWTFSSNPQCRNFTCPSPLRSKMEANRWPSTGNIEPGAALIIACSVSNSSNIINKTLVCAPDTSGSESFSLQGDNSTCPEVDCGSPWTIEGALAVTTPTTFGSSFQFACDNNQGFVPSGASVLGNATVICQSNGRWGYGSLGCESASCGDPGTNAGTVQIVRTSYKINQTVQYNCTQPGYTAFPSDTIVCEYRNRQANWSSPAPTCQDTTPPNIKCPSTDSFDLYETLNYQVPSASDNSGTSCTVLMDNGPPPNVSVVSKDMVVKYVAFDARKNNESCEIKVSLKDLFGPNISCQHIVEWNLRGIDQENVSLTTQNLHIYHSNVGAGQFTPKGSVLLGPGRAVPIRFRITKENKRYKECAFILKAQTKVCNQTSVQWPENGKIPSCSGGGSNMNCTVSCETGFLFPNHLDSLTLNCRNGTWTPDLHIPACAKISDATFDFDVNLTYLVTGHPPTHTDPLEIKHCAEAQYIHLFRQVESMSACFSKFSATGMNTYITAGITRRRIEFTLKLLNSSVDINLTKCSDDIKSSVSTFGLTNMSVVGINCYLPWHLNLSSVIAKSYSCEYATADYNNKKVCLPCGQGMFYNGTCQVCPDGFYQDEQNSSHCKQCPQGVLKSHLPRSQEKHCYELCPEGFMSTSGYMDNDNCTSCSENSYSSSSSIYCLPCPNNGSTLGVSGAVSERLCSDPCPVGQYSLTGFEPCKPCPRHFYSNSTGASSCTECPSDTYTLDSNSSSVLDCKKDNAPCTYGFCSAIGTKSNTQCTIVNHRPVCSCKEGYKGDSCLEKCDVCSPNPCYNGGICQQDDNFGFTCQCKSESNCSFVPNSNVPANYYENAAVTSLEMDSEADCKTNCSNDNSCVAYTFEDNFCYIVVKWSVVSDDQALQGYFKNCSIKPYFIGPRCEVDLINDCDGTVCSREEYCQDLVNATRCVCPPGGQYDASCADTHDPCVGQVCSNHGSCVSYNSVRAVCHCDPGFTGDKCQVNIDECALNANGCLYKGYCKDQVDSYSCNCLNGFSGSHCEARADLCQGNGCNEQDRGFCIPEFYNITSRCACRENYLPGPLKPGSCIPKSFCSSNPCLNGVCEESIGGFKCRCKTGYEGSLCQHNTDDCISNQCQNGAVCIDSIPGYSCQCPEGFTGRYCEKDVDDCVPPPCQNGGTCRDQVGDFTCQCKEGFTGKNCSQDLLECNVTEPCLHGGICTDFYGGYNCTCPVGWTGINCERKVDFCVSKPCQNAGHCVSLIDSFYCQCLNGTVGKTCEKVTRVCDNFKGSVCTAYGHCEPRNDTAECHCTTDYDGKACELHKNYCEDNPCNNLTCVLKRQGYECYDGNVKYSGEKFNEEVMSCDECPKEAKCQLIKNYEGFPKNVCLCPAYQILSGNTCRNVSNDFDLAFLESPAGNRSAVTSQRGFYLDQNNSLSVSMWVAAAREMYSDHFLLALRSVESNEYFLQIYKDSVFIKINQTYTHQIKLENKYGPYFLDELFYWHFVSVSWSTNGNVMIIFDFVEVANITLPAAPPNDKFVFANIGEAFNGYISQVYVWKSFVSFSEYLEMYDQKLYIAQMDSLLLGWIPYTFDSTVIKTASSSFDGSFSVCDIPNSIAKYGLETDECRASKLQDKVPPVFTRCDESRTQQINSSVHEISLSFLGYTSTDGPYDTPSSPHQWDLVSPGAQDVAITAADKNGNVGVCRTRLYVTANTCNDTKPSQFLSSCTNSINTEQVKCPNGLLPSVPTPKFISCGRLQTYNLDSMYEKPDKIVCGATQSITRTVQLTLPYTVDVDCDNYVLSDFYDAVRTTLVILKQIWPALCTGQQCTNLIMTGSCQGNDNLTLHVNITGLNETIINTANQENKTLDVIHHAVEQLVSFDYSDIGLSVLDVKNVVAAVVPSCSSGHRQIGLLCVECGPGSYYQAEEMTCRLCELNTYSNSSGLTHCLSCPGGRITLQRGSSQITDCKAKCDVGQMLDETGLCVDCQPNFYQDQEGKSYCLPCPPSMGTSTAGATSRAACVVKSG